MPIFIPDLFSAYIRGRQQAIQDNWNDLNQYNKVEAGQLANGMTMATFDDNVRKNTAAADLAQTQAVGAGFSLDDALRKRALAQQAGTMEKQVQAAAATLQTNLAQQQRIQQQLADPLLAAVDRQLLQNELLALQKQYQQLLSGQSAGSGVNIPQSPGAAPGVNSSQVLQPQPTPQTQPDYAAISRDAARQNKERFGMTGAPLTVEELQARGSIPPY